MSRKVSDRLSRLASCGLMKGLWQAGRTGNAASGKIIAVANSYSQCHNACIYGIVDFLYAFKVCLVGSVTPPLSAFSVLRSLAGPSLGGGICLKFGAKTSIMSPIIVFRVE